MSKEKTVNKISHASYSLTTNRISNPWGPNDIDKLDIWDNKEFNKVVSACRFFYKHDPVVSTVINKMIDIAITDVWFTKKDMDINQFRLFLGLKAILKDFAENMALEYLLSGLVIPEISYATVNKDILKEFGIKKYEARTLPETMWLRDPTTIKIKSAFSTTKPSYFVTIPQDIINFIQSRGKYADGTQDIRAYEMLLRDYPEFVAAVLRGEREFLLDNHLIIRRRYTTQSPYPIPYMYSVLESLKHKRNLRRMDYSIAARAIKAIQVFKLGNDLYPITEENQEMFESLKSQMVWRDSGGTDIEMVFQLFANHTLEVEWVFPPLDALLSDTKYREVNHDIIVGLGFPGVLLTGEAEKSNTSSPDFATLAPIKTMNNMRDKIRRVLNSVVTDIAIQNGWKKVPYVDFKPINMQSFKDLIAAFQMLYNGNNISRQSIAEAFGYDWKDEVEKIKEEGTIIKESGIDAFARQPFSNQPGETNGKPNNNEPEKPKKPKKSEVEGG
jgi:hypothetical protein